jgi:hypothetical protein
MPIINTEDLKAVDSLAFKNYLDFVQKDDTAYQNLRFLALLGVGPATFVLLIESNDRNWKRAFIPRRVWNRLRAFSGPNAEVMIRMAQARQLPIVHWLMFVSCAATIGAIFTIGFGVQLVHGVLQWMRSCMWRT